MSELERVCDAAVSGHLMWRASQRECEQGREEWDRENEREERRDAGRGWQNNISADSAAASGPALTFSEKLEERDQVKVRRSKGETHTHEWQGEMGSAGKERGWEM